ncbi:TOMM precursor leader peptide-binding protein [Nannocystis pusilla]|uniref:TOMM precursor leader peptide-binding protein n=1 Tax=Nannocystis pusilla TaxID=889268 RepID=UPI003DA289EF
MAKLDGTHDFSALLSGERTSDAFYALRMLDALTQLGFLAEGPLESATAEHDIPAVMSPPQNSLAQAVAIRLEALGVAARACEDEITAADVRLLCPDGPDLARIETTHRSALEAHFAFLAILPFGDAVLVGPLIRPGCSACFRCFLLRWLAISPSIELERAWLARLRTGMWRPESRIGQAEAADIAAPIAATVARLLARSDDGARLALIDRESRAITEATLVRHPRCEACAAPTDPEDHEPSPLSPAAWLEPPIALAELGRRAAPLVSDLCGVAAWMPPPRGCESLEPALPHIAVARFAMPQPEEAGGALNNWCHGAAASRAEAEAVAIIEAVERYSGLSPAKPGLLATYAAVAERALSPTALALFSPSQYLRSGFPFQPFDAARPLWWTCGYNFTRGRPVLVPSSSAWYGHDDWLLGETSSGVAAHGSRGAALLHGALELVERDAFMIHWLHRLSPPLVNVDSIDNVVCRRLVDQVETRGYAVRVADICTDLAVPVYLALGIRDDGQRPALLVGAGASLDPALALGRALSELHAASHNATEGWSARPPLAPCEVLRLEDHSRAYEHPDWLRHASFLWASARRAIVPQRSLASDACDDLCALSDRLARRGHDLIGVDITAPDVVDSGIRVVRAIVPGLQPLGFGPLLRLGGSRLYEAPVRMAYHPARTSEDALNPIPHCFP